MQRWIWILIAGFMVLQVEAKIDPESQATIAQMEKFSEAFAAVASEVNPGVVAVIKKRDVLVGVRRSTGNPFFDHFFGGGLQYRREQRQQGLGSGVIVSRDGYVLTNNHVIAEADAIEVELGDGRTFDATLVGTDPQSDVAVLKIDGRDLPALKMGDSDKLKVGSWVLAIGNPYGLRHTVTYGIVSAIGRGNLDIVDYEDFIQTDAAINPGNSGGAMVNLRGELVGLNTAILSRSGGSQGIGLAVPINMARNIMQQIIEDGEVKRGYLDVVVQDLTPGLSEALGLSVNRGALIQEVGEFAEQTGLQPGDVIVGLNDREISNADEFLTRIARIPPGAQVIIEVIRSGENRKLRVTVDAFDPFRGLQESERQRALGLNVQEMTPAIARQFGYDAQWGMLITDVREGSAAEAARLQRGDVIREMNRRAMRSMEDYEDVLAELKPGDEVGMVIRRETRRHYANLYAVLKVPK